LRHRQLAPRHREVGAVLERRQAGVNIVDEGQ
jgi:hypothetical protein